MQAFFTFVAELKDFLPPNRRDVTFAYPFEGTPSIKHLIEALGIPHTEVHHIVVNDKVVDFSYLVQDDDHIRIYPYSTQYNDANPSEEIILSDSEPRFILDNHLGRLANYLRMMGFDTLYRNDFQDDELAIIASQEDRILLTRDRRLLMRSVIRDGYWVRAKVPRQQVIEILKRFNLYHKITPFRRCMRCNDLLQPVDKGEVIDRLEPLTKKYYNKFRICHGCGQVYWQGSHYARMEKFIDQVKHSQSINLNS